MARLWGHRMADNANYSELLDLRTHLTVAMLASSQLKRKAGQAEEFVRLHAYLTHSLVQLQSAIAGLESLGARVDQEQEQEPQPTVPRGRRFPPQWIGMGMVFVAAKLRGFLPARPLAMQHAMPLR